MTIEQELLIDSYLRTPWRMERSIARVRRYLERNYAMDGCETAESAYELLTLVEALFDERKQSQAK